MVSAFIGQSVPLHSMYCCINRWRTFERKAPFATTSFKRGGFQGWAYFHEITVLPQYWWRPPMLMRYLQVENGLHNSQTLRPWDLRHLETRGPLGCSIPSAVRALLGSPRVHKSCRSHWSQCLTSLDHDQRCHKLQHIFEANTSITTDRKLWTQRAVGLATLQRQSQNTLFPFVHGLQRLRLEYYQSLQQKRGTIQPQQAANCSERHFFIQVK